MPTAKPRTIRNPIPAGDHTLTLVAVTEEEFDSLRNPNEKVLRWCWLFKSNQKDPTTGERYEYRHYTGEEYGGPKAEFTKIADMMFPDLSDEDKAHLITEDYYGEKFRAIIHHEKPQDPKDPPKARMAFIQPLHAAPAEKGKKGKEAAADDDVPVIDDKDPFAEE